MAFEITIPRLGWSMEEGTFVRWLKQDGEIVKPGDALFELEGEKAAQDIEAVDGGILCIPATAPQPGTVVAVGTVIGHLVAEGEQVANVNPVPQPAASAEAKRESEAVPAAPSVRRMARERGINLAAVAGSGPAGKILANDIHNANGIATDAESSRTSVASPRARRVANELRIDWRTIAGTGRGGRIREQDVRRAAAAAPVHSSTGESTPITRHRRTISDRMMRSQRETAPVTLTTRIDATNLVSLRLQFKTSVEVVPSYTDITIKLVSLVLPRHPLLMSQWANDQLVVPDAMNIGVAVDTPAGLMVPVIENVSALSLVDVAGASARLIARSREGKLKVAEMQNGVFTVTNLGAFGIDAFTPIINSPESAILGLGRIRREPAVVDNQVVPRDQMTLSLTFDHRIVDGAPAARFLQEVAQAIESPSAWLLRND